MKFSWGHGITVFIIAFMAFIVTLVIMTFSTNADLVQDDYYEQEVLFEDKQQSIKNYQNADFKVEYKHEADGFKILFPEDYNSTIKGKVFFYRFDNKKFDKAFDLNLDQNNQQTFDYSEFLEGAYNMSIKWDNNNTSYLFESKVTF